MAGGHLKSLQLKYIPKGAFIIYLEGGLWWFWGGVTLFPYYDLGGAVENFQRKLSTKSLSQSISITLLQISLKLYEHRGCYWRNKLPWMIFEEQFPVPRYTAAIKIGNSVISLLWQLRCRCNPDHNKFSSSRNTTVVAIFPKHCLWRRSLCSNLGGIHPEKLYRATLSNDIHFVHVTLRILKIRMKLYKLLFINKQFGP